jgi:NADPH:quinone reductase-like Zn-dependent oxidoreductase
MKAAVCRGSRVVIEDVEKPVPTGDEVLIRVHATTICAADYRLRTLMPYVGWLIALIKRKPNVLGMELSGTVESVGPGVTRFHPGDQVFGASGFALRTHAEYACARERGVELQPTKMSREESAAVFFGAMTSLIFLRQANIQPCQKVLIYGASGSVGVFAIQIAKHWGAHVTGVCSTSNLEMVKSLGADATIDYTKEDFWKAGPIYDVILDTVGKANLWRCLDALKPGAPLVLIALSGGFFSIFKDVAQQTWARITRGAKLLGGVGAPKPGDFGMIRDLIEAGTLRTVIDRVYPFARIEEAMDYAGAGHKRGHVVILTEFQA